MAIGGYKCQRLLPSLLLTWFYALDSYRKPIAVFTLISLSADVNILNNVNATCNRPRLEGVALAKLNEVEPPVETGLIVVTLGAEIGIGIAIGIGIDHKVENIFFTIYAISDPEALLLSTARRNGLAYSGLTAKGRGFSWY